MTALSVLVPLSIVMGTCALMAFLWSLRAKQYEDLDGAAERILIDEDDGHEKSAGNRSAARKTRQPLNPHDGG